MVTQDGSGGWTRRGFLRAGATGAGTLAAASLLPPARAARAAPPVARGRADSATPTTIGVLLPTSRAYPELGPQFLSGLRLGFAAGQGSDGNVRLLVEEVGPGERAVAEALATLLATAQPALIVGLLGDGLATRLHARLEAARTPLLASSVGETVPRAGQPRPLLFRHTLAQWQADWALGRWAAAHVGHRAALATSFHDGGYDTLAAFRLGFEGAGGEILRTHITHLPPEMGPDGPLVAPLLATGPDFLYASYAGPEALDFVQAYAGSGLADRVPLLGTGFLTAGPVLPLLGEAALGIRTAAAWADGSDDEVARTFRADYRAATAREPDPFALLGCETALLASAAFRAAGDGATPTLLRDALLTTSVAGPRGRVTMQPATQGTYGPIGVREVRLSGGTPTNVPLAGLETIDELDGRIAALRTGMRTGWLNTYLCD